jgi:hypothetical protein
MTELGWKHVFVLSLQVVEAHAPVVPAQRLLLG